MTTTYDFSQGLQLKIRQLGENAIEFELRNCFYAQQRHHKFKQFLVLLILFGFYFSMSCLATYFSLRLLQRSLFADIGFLLYFLFLFVTTSNLIKKEKLLFCSEFAMQMEIERFLSRRSNKFIPVSNIYDIRINEVIENIDIHYMLIVRTKGHLFKKKPIIPLLNSQKPNLACLELIYKHMNKIRQKKMLPDSVPT